MKKIGLLVMMMLSVLVLSACKEKNVFITADNAKNNEIIVSTKGKVQSVIKESFNKDYYNEKDLKNFIKEDLKEFNSQNKTKITLNSMKVKKGNVYAVLDYSKISDYNSYNEYELKLLSKSKAKSNDLVPSKFDVYGKKKTVDKDKALKDKKAKVVILSVKKEDKDTETDIETTKKVDLLLTVSGKIKYVANASKNDSNTAKVSSLDKPVVIVYK